MKTRIFAATMPLLTVAIGTLSATEPASPPPVGIALYQDGKIDEAQAPLNL